MTQVLHHIYRTISPYHDQDIYKCIIYTASVSRSVYLLYPDCFNSKFPIAGIDGALSTAGNPTFNASDSVATTLFIPSFNSSTEAVT